MKGKRGWFRHPVEHGLAAKGIKTKKLIPNIDKELSTKDILRLFLSNLDKFDDDTLLEIKDKIEDMWTVKPDKAGRKDVEEFDNLRKTMGEEKLLDYIFDMSVDAYSFDNYTAGGWKRIIKFLLAEGFSPNQVKEILLSKHMRWAADASDKPYGRVTSEDFFGYYRDHQRDINDMLIQYRIV